MRHAYTGRMHTYTVPYTYEDGPEEIGTVEYLICVRGSAPTAPTLRTDPDDCDPGDPGELEILHVEEDAKDGKILSIEEFEKIVGVNAYDHVMKYIERNDNFWNTRETNMDAIFHIRRAYAEAFQAYKSLILNATPESFKKKCEAVLVVDGLDNPKPTDWLRVAVWAVEEAQAECERLDALAKQYGID